MTPTASPSPTTHSAPAPSRAPRATPGSSPAAPTDDFAATFGDARSAQKAAQNTTQDRAQPPTDSARHANRRDDAAKPAGAHGTRRAADHDRGRDGDRDGTDDRDADATAAAAILALLALTQPAGRASAQAATKAATNSDVDARELGFALGQTGSKSEKSALGHADLDILGGDKTPESGKLAAKNTGTAQSADKAQGSAGTDGSRDGNATSIFAVLRAGAAQGDATRIPVGAATGHGHHDSHPGDASPTAAAVGTPAPASAGAAAPVVQRSLSLPIDHPQWSQAVAEAIVDAGGANGGRLRLQLHPADLGPVDIALDIEHDRAKVQISALQPTTRAALQQAIPQLTALLAGQGLQLTHADVSAGQSHQQYPRGDASPTATDAASPSPIAAGAAPRTLLLRNGLIDDYA